MRKIIITEKQEQKLIGMMLNEAKVYSVEPGKVLLVKEYLDKNFVHATYETTGPDGKLQVAQIGVCKSPTNGKPNEEFRKFPKQMFQELEEEFKDMYTDKVQRTKFLQQVLRDWFADKITKEGLLSVNRY